MVNSKGRTRRKTRAINARGTVKGGVYADPGADIARSRLLHILRSVGYKRIKFLSSGRNHNNGAGRVSDHILRDTAQKDSLEP